MWGAGVCGPLLLHNIWRKSFTALLKDKKEKKLYRRQETKAHQQRQIVVQYPDSLRRVEGLVCGREDLLRFVSQPLHHHFLDNLNINDNDSPMELGFLENGAWVETA